MSEFGESVGKTPGLEIWRIEDLKPVPYAKKSYGKFYEGDSYIILKTTQKPDSETLNWDLFFWIGEKSSQDEQGVAAFKAVELDEILGGAAIQHRETQGHESDLFLQSFKSVEYKKGGVKSGFVHVDRDSYETRLLQVKGARSVRVNEVPLSASSLNAGDVFILDVGLTIYQWNGAKCNRKEKTKALEVTCAIRDVERSGKALIEVIEQGDETDAFWTALGGKGDVANVVPDDESDAKSTSAKGTIRLIKVSDASGSITESEVSSGGPLHKEMLSSDDVFIVANDAEIFVWVGKGASAEERRSGMNKGMAHVTSSGRPTWTKVSKVLEGAETPAFLSNFESWPVSVDFSAMPKGNVAHTEETSVNELSKSMAAMGKEAEAATMVDDGSGTVECFRIEDFEPVPTEPHLFGQLFAGDSYVIKYTYMDGNKECYIIYFWQGSQSSNDETSAAALHAVKMDDDLGGAAVQVRLTQGKETPHFVAIFKGSLVVRSGGRAAGFKNSEEADTYDTDGVSLFQIKGTSATDTRAVQVEEKAASLNSGDCFVLLTPDKIYLWCGSLANDQEKETGRGVADKLKGKRSLVELFEGSEASDFWDKLGGKGEYTTKKEMPQLSREPMLFHCSTESGAFKVSPVHNFSQSDLEEDDVYILDTYSTVFVWVGSEANEHERKRVLELADAYVKDAGYKSSTTIVQVKSGSEPRNFTAHFLGWDPEKTKKFVDPYAAKLAAAMAEQEEVRAAQEAEDAAKLAEAEAEAAAKQKAAEEAAAKAKAEAEAAAAAEAQAAKAKEAAPAAPTATAAANGAFKDPATFSLPYEQLKDQIPAGVDPAKKEQYLSDSEFQKVMGCSRAEFGEMKGWKQQQVKKSLGLF